MADNKVSIELTIEDVAAMKSLENFSKKINRATKDTTDFGKKADESFKKSGDSAKGLFKELSNGASSGFGELVKGVTIANLATSAITGLATGIKNFVADSVGAAMAQENAMNRLAAALRRAGEYSKEAMFDLHGYALEMQNTTVHGDEAILNQLAFAKSLGLTNQQAKELVEGAVQLSAALGMNLESAVKNLGKTYSGLAGELGEALPSIRTLSAESMKAGGAIRLVNEQFAGAAQAEMETYHGVVSSLNSAYVTMQEELGFLVTRNETFKASLSALSSATNGLANMFKDLGSIINGTEFDQAQIIENLNAQSTVFAQLTDRIAAYQNQISKFESGDMGWFEKLGFDVDSARKKITELTAEQSKLIDLMNTAQASSNAVESAVAQETDAKTLQAREQLYAQLQYLQTEHAAWELEQEILKQEITEENFQIELERFVAMEQEKINAKYLAEEEKNKLIEDSVARQLATESTATKKSLEIQKASVEAEKKMKQQQVVLEQQKQAAMAGAALAGLHLLGTIAKDGSKEQFLIQKAAAIASAAIASKVAYMQALAFPPGPPATIPTASWVAAAGAASVAAITASAIKGFATGGIVDSNRRQGDQNIIRVNGGEAVLTQSQQQRFMDIANGVGSAEGGNMEEIIERVIEAIESRPTIISIDGREIARSVKEQKEMGFVL